MDTIEHITSFMYPEASLARGFGISVAALRASFMTGSGATKIVENSVASRLRLKMALKSNERFDVYNPETGERYEIRCMHGSSVSLLPSVQTGSGRHFDQSDFRKWARNLTSFLIVDTSAFPVLHVYEISAKTVITLQKMGVLGKGARLSRKLFNKISEPRPSQVTLMESIPIY